MTKAWAAQRSRALTEPAMASVLSARRGPDAAASETRRRPGRCAAGQRRRRRGRRAAGADRGRISSARSAGISTAPRAPSICRRPRCRRCRRRPSQTTAQAIGQYEGILARGGWPKVPPADRLRLGNRHPSVVPLRKRLIVAGDLEATAGATDIYNSYVEAAVRRFQARHGITVDGIVREETFDAAQHAVRRAARPAQDQCRRGCADLTAHLPSRLRRRAISRRRRSRRWRTASPFPATPPWSASRTGRRPRSTARSSRSISIPTGPCRCRSCGAISFR